jgi:F-type H+-transporting ATPase subunit b
MDAKSKAGLAKALTAASGPAIVRSAFEPPPAQRAEIQKALNETFSEDIHIRFETAPNLISGIELVSNGQKVAWSIADYLEALKNGVDEILKEKTAPRATAQTLPDAKPEPKDATKAGAEPDEANFRSTKP